MHALIIESQYFTAMLIEECLRPLGYDSFAYAMDEEEAVATAIGQCPDLITADPALTFGCGIAAVQRICREKPIPVVYITADSDSIRARCPEAIVVLKPFGLNEMREGADRARQGLAA